MKPEVKPKRSEVEHLLQSVLVPAYPPNRSFILGRKYCINYFEYILLANREQFYDLRAKPIA